MRFSFYTSSTISKEVSAVELALSSSDYIEFMFLFLKHKANVPTMIQGEMKNIP